MTALPFGRISYISSREEREISLEDISKGMYWYAVVKENPRKETNVKKAVEAEYNREYLSKESC